VQDPQNMPLHATTSYVIQKTYQAVKVSLEMLLQDSSQSKVFLALSANFDEVSCCNNA